MQNSEVFGGCIVLPLDAEALKSLSEENVKENMNVWCIDLEEIFSEVFRTGLFDKINKQCGIIIDEYETEVSSTDFVGGIIGLVDEYLESIHGDVLMGFMKEFRGMLIEAEKLKLPIYFVF